MQPNESPNNAHPFEYGQTLNLLWPTSKSEPETINGVEFQGIDTRYGEPCVYRGDYPLASPMTLVVVQVERTRKFLAVEPKDLSAHGTA